MRILRALSQPWLGPLIRQRKICRAMLAFMVVLGAGVALGLSLWPCIFADLTGLPCPGCGMTRSLTAWLRGDVSSALRFHPLSPFLIGVGGFVTAGALLPHARAKALADRVALFEEKSRCTALFLAVLLIFSLMRILGFWYQPELSRPSLFPLIRQMAGQQDESSNPHPPTH